MGSLLLIIEALRGLEAQVYYSSTQDRYRTTLEDLVADQAVKSYGMTTLQLRVTMALLHD